MKYTIFQLPLSDKNIFEGSPANIDFDKVSIYNYVPIWQDNILDKPESDESLLEICEGLSYKFNVDIPENFAGHSMSTSDVIAFSQLEGGARRAFFCDTFGFEELHHFFDRK